MTDQTQRDAAGVQDGNINEPAATLHPLDQELD